MSSRRPPPDTTPPDAPRISRRALLGWSGTSALLTACGGGGGGGDGPAPEEEPGPTLPHAQRLLVLDAVADEYERLCNGAIRADSEAVAAFMRGRPEYRRVTVMPDGCICGEFTDGQLHVVGNNLRTGQPMANAMRSYSRSQVDAPERQARRMRTSAAASGTVPTSASAADGPPLTGVPASAAGLSASTFINYADPDGTPGEIERFEHWLDRAGIDIVQHWRPSVTNLKELPELGFFNWLTHGGMLRTDGGITHALMTSTPANLETIVAHLQDLQAGNLVYYSGYYLYSRGKWVADNHLAITPAFITRYRWRFSANSVVLIHACASDFVGFRDAFQAAGAGVYGGWSHPVWVYAAVEAMHWMVDKFVASNLAVPTASPRNRPHAYDTIKRVGDAASLTSYDDPEEGGTVEFRLTRLNDDPGGLLPSLVRMEVEESQAQLMLYGSFGTAQGRVFAGTRLGTDPSGHDNYLPWRPEGTVTELTVVQWTPAAVTVQLPRSGAGSAGYIAVRIGRRWSNARALTRWHGQMLVTSQGPGTLQIQHTLQYSARCDIGYWRDEPDGTLQDMPRTFTGTPFDAPSTWTWAASGQHIHSEPGPVTTTVQWSGTHRFELPQTWRHTDPQYYSIFGQVSRSLNQFRVAISGGAIGAMPVSDITTTPGGSTRHDGLYAIGLPLALSPAPFPPGQPGIARTLGDDFSVSAGTLSSTEPTLLPVADPEVDHLAHTMDWDTMAAQYAPDGYGGA